MHLFLSAGEPSGDQHAAKLIHELRAQTPQLEVSGLGGPLMQAAGCRIHFRLTDLAVMGIFRVLPLLGKFFSVFRLASEKLRAERPDAVVLVDFPGFNWWIAWKAKQLGIPVFYYLPPQLWAWAPWRIRKVKRTVDHVLCGLSFEQDWYQQRGVAAEFVGHPFFDEIAEHPLDEKFVNERRGTIGILPGSRNQEVELNWPVMVEVMQRLVQQHPQVTFSAACFRETHRERCQAYVREHATSLPIEFHVEKTPEIIEAASCCLMVSGSVSLQMLARETPAVVVYYVAGLTRLLGRLVVTCRFASLPNLMLDRALLPEFFPRNDGGKTAAEITEVLSRWLSDEAHLATVRGELRELHRQVGATGASARAAAAILRRLQSPAVERAA